MKKTKMQHYAKLISNAKERARAEIEKMESAGFSINERIRDLIDEPTPAQISKKAYQRLSTALNLQHIRSLSKLEITAIRKENYHKDIAAIHSAISYADYISPTRLARRINEIIRTPQQISENEYRPIKSEDLSRKISLLMSALTGKAIFPRAGLKNEFFEISSDYDSKNPLTLSEKIIFKKIPIDSQNADYYLKLLTQQPYTNAQLYQIYLEDARNRGYLKNVQTTKISPQTAETLQWLLNSSHLWRIAHQDIDDSDQVRDRWKVLAEEISSIHQAKDRVANYSQELAEIVRMIENEEDYSDIIDKIESVIKSAWQN